jgi:hypothetical protein
VGRELFPEQFLPQIPPNFGLLDQLGKGIAQVWGQLSSFVQSLIPPYEIEAEWERVQFVSAGPGATGSLSAVWISHPSLYDAGIYQPGNIPADAQLMLFSRFSEYNSNYYGWTYEWMWNGGYGWLEAGLFNERVRFEGSHAHLTWPEVEWVHTRADGSSVPLTAAPFVGNPPRTKVPLRRKAAVLPQTKAAVLPLPLPNPSRVIPPVREDESNDTPQPQREFEPQPQPQPQPQPLPQQLPGQTPFAPQPATTPTTKPATFVPVVVPQVTPNRTTQTNADGSRKTASIIAPATTPAGNEKIGPVTVTTNAPQATLAGIAGEVGRIEQKLAKMIRPPADGDLTDRLGLLGSVLKALYEEFFTGLPPGEYILSSPCERDEQGDRVEYQVPILSTNNRFDAIFERLDALADLIQTHKDLKQPICRGTQPTGQPVTVNFTQID